MRPKLLSPISLASKEKILWDYGLGPHVVPTALLKLELEALISFPISAMSVRLLVQCIALGDEGKRRWIQGSWSSFTV
jgi:hypothetical protein